MKLGLIPDRIDCPLAKALDQIGRTIYQIDVVTIPASEFKPAMVAEKGLDAVLLEGGTTLNEAQAVAVKRNVSVPVLYFSHGRIELPLAQSGIECYQPIGDETGAVQLFMRLKQLGSGPATSGR